MRWLWMWLPDEAWVLVIAAIGFGVMFRLVSLRAAGAALGGIAIMFLTAPFFDALFQAMPWWISALILVGAVFATIRGLMALLFGRLVAAHALGTLLADVIRFVFLMPFRLIGALLRR